MKKYCLIAVLLFQGNVYAQINSAEQRNLPTINVIALNESHYEVGKISVKFNRQVFDRLTITETDKKVSFNNIVLNKLSTVFGFSKCQSLFRNVLKNKDLEFKHKKWGLDLWFAVDFNKNLDVKQLYAALQKTNLFQVVEPVYKKHLLDDNSNSATFTPNDLRFAEQWGYNNTGQGNGTAGKDIKLIDAWNIETGKPNVLVAVHDMGIQLDHPDLAQNIAIGKSFNFIDNNDTIVQGYHGTHTAGTIAAVNNNGIGVSGIAGGDGTINSGVRLMSIQIFKGNQNAGLAEGFVFAADKGAAISSNSWAYDIENIYELSVLDAIDYFIANGGGNVIQGGLVIFASGNKSRTIRYFPSAYDPVICVSATNNRDSKANYSTFGSWVDISAPGGDYNTGGASQILSTTTNSGYAGDHGTSMACPHVSGVAALIASKLSGKASSSDIRDILLTTTDNIDALNPNYIGLLGTGRLNAFNALQKAQTIYNGLNVLPIDSVWVIHNCNTININWNKNISNNNVIVAYSNKNGIGTLTNGTNYNVGDKLMGEGKIIYKGNASSFAINNNDSLFHYFKVWSVDTSINYSFGKTTELVGTGYVNTSGGYIQNFDFPPYFPTVEWRTINPDNDISWIHTAADTANTGAGDAYSMVMYNYNYNNLLGAVDVLTSPLINVQNTDSLKLSFWYAYKYRNTGLPIADSLEALVSTDCGVNYSSLWKKGGFDLATISSTTDSIFYPFGIDKWKNVLIDLTSYKTNNKLKFAFRSVNGKGNNLFLDNITVDIRYQRDAALVNIVSPQNASCDTVIIPTVIVKNLGNDVLNTLKIAYSIDGNAILNTNWTGSLIKGDTVTISLNQSTVTRGNHNIIVSVSQPNNLVDNFVLNDTLRSSFYITPITKMPIAEGFEGVSFPPQNWFVNQLPKDAISWVKTNLAGSNSANSCLIQNFYYDNKRRLDDLMTPIFESYNNGDSCYLSFDYAHATRKNPAATGVDFDSLEISYSSDCGDSWITIWKKGGNGLQTINQTQAYGNEFIPQANEWKSDSMLVSGIFNMGDKIQVRFRSIENFGNNIYIDNVKLYSKYTLAILLPVVLGDYSLQLYNDSKTVVNNWNTTNETNSSHFNVQRSLNGKDFINVGRVVANVITGKYSFNDKIENINKNVSELFYRLEMVSKNGNKTYSETKRLDLNNEKEAFVIYPNPATKELKINNIKLSNELINIYIVNSVGLKISYTNFSVLNGYLRLNISNLANGLYYLQLVYKNKTISQKILINN